MSDCNIGDGIGVDFTRELDIGKAYPINICEVLESFRVDALDVTVVELCRLIQKMGNYATVVNRMISWMDLLPMLSKPAPLNVFRWQAVQTFLARKAMLALLVSGLCLFLGSGLTNLGSGSLASSFLNFR